MHLNHKKGNFAGLWFVGMLLFDMLKSCNIMNDMKNILWSILTIVCFCVHLNRNTDTEFKIYIYFFFRLKHELQSMLIT